MFSSKWRLAIFGLGVSWDRLGLPLGSPGLVGPPWARDRFFLFCWGASSAVKMVTWNLPKCTKTNGFSAYFRTGACSTLQHKIIPLMGKGSVAAVRVLFLQSSGGQKWSSVLSVRNENGRRLSPVQMEERQMLENKAPERQNQKTNFLVCSQAVKHRETQLESAAGSAAGQLWCSGALFSSIWRFSICTGERHFRWCCVRSDFRAYCSLVLPNGPQQLFETIC